MTFLKEKAAAQICAAAFSQKHLLYSLSFSISVGIIRFTINKFFWLQCPENKNNRGDAGIAYIRT